jgi:hypothetical protein
MYMSCQVAMYQEQHRQSHCKLSIKFLSVCNLASFHQPTSFFENIGIGTIDSRLYMKLFFQIFIITKFFTLARFNLIHSFHTTMGSLVTWQTIRQVGLSVVGRANGGQHMSKHSQLKSNSGVSLAVDQRLQQICGTEATYRTRLNQHISCGACSSSIKRILG